MAPKSPLPPPAAKAAPEDTAPPAVVAGLAGPTVGELEEAREERDQALAQNALLMSQMGAMMSRLDALERAKASRPHAAPDAPREAHGPGETPVFDPSAPHGLVVGDSNIAYVQNGHQFASDRSYVATERDRGSPRAFNPRLVGVVRRPVIREQDAA